jgi:hypothetical protein
MYWRGEKCIDITVEKRKVKRPFWRPRRSWKDNIKIALNETEC